MEKLENLRNSLEDALTTIAEAIQSLENDEGRSEHDSELMRDGLIKRFEFTYDTFWKYLKEFILEEYSVAVKPPSPRNVSRVAHEHELMTEGQMNLAFDMIGARNETTHTYDREVGIQVAKSVPKFYELMNTVFEKSQQLSDKT